MTAQHKRVVITGLGVVAPNGVGKESFWQACITGRSGIRRITRFDASNLPVQIAGEVPAFDPLANGLSSEEVAILDRGTQFAVAAACLAWQDSGLPPLSEAERAATGVYMGAAMAGADEGVKLWLRLTDRGAHSPRFVEDAIHPATILMSFSPSSAIASHFQLYGPSLVIATGCSAGADAIGQAYWAIQEGRAQRMLAGGSDSSINTAGINVFAVMKALSTRNDDPERASRPYDGERDGFVMAEGAGVLLLEERELALARGAHIYAEISAFVSNSNAYHMTALPEDGQPLRDLLRHAMQEAGITSDQLHYINSHGSSTPYNERVETAAYKAVFGSAAYHIPISATKSMIGHTQGAASAIEAVVTVLAIERQLLPPTINQHVSDPNCDLDYIPNIARPAVVHHAITHSSGFGGVNTALVLAHPDIDTDGTPPPVGTPLVGVRGMGIQGVSVRGMGVPDVDLGMRNQAPRRVVITGLGIIAPNGLGKNAFWQAVSNGVSGIQPFARIPIGDLRVQVGGEVRDFVAEDYLDRKLVNRTDRSTHFALAATDEALRDARLTLEQESPQRVGIVIANTLGGIEFVLEQVAAMYLRGPRAMSAYTAIAWLPVANTGQVSLRYGIQGYCKAPINDLIGSLDALGLAYRAIQRGAADIIITGGCEAPLHPLALQILARSGFSALGDDPHAYRPFDERASGFLPAEGAGICILEDYEHARQRGAPIYGEITGYGQTGDALHAYRPCADGTRYARALSLAMQEASISPSDIGYLSLDGRALPASDAAEAEALSQALASSAQQVPVSVPRTMFGHSFAAAGAIDTITALLALEYGMIPPTINSTRLVPAYQLNLIRESYRIPLQRVLIAGRSLSGVNSALAITRVQ